jgi:hypothetical protein
MQGCTKSRVSKEGKGFRMAEKILECVVENRGKRSFIVNPEDHVKGGKECVGPNGKIASFYIGPDTTVKVTKKCADNLVKTFKGEIRIIKKSSRGV